MDGLIMLLLNTYDLPRISKGCFNLRIYTQIKILKLPTDCHQESDKPKGVLFASSTPLFGFLFVLPKNFYLNGKKKKGLLEEKPLTPQSVKFLFILL